MSLFLLINASMFGLQLLSGGLSGELVGLSGKFVRWLSGKLVRRLSGLSGRT